MDVRWRTFQDMTIMIGIMDNSKWLLVLPPEGAARTVGERTWEALCARLPAPQRKLFDTKPYLEGFDKLLKDPTDQMVVDLVNQSLVVQCLDFEASHVLVLALSPVTFFTANLLRRRGIKTLHWFYEDFRQAKYWREVAGAYDHFLAIQRGAIETECAAKGVRFHYLPTAATLPADRPVRPWRERPGDVAFIGFPSVYRIAVLEALVTAGIPLKVAGEGWEKYRGPLQACMVSKGWAGSEETFRLLEAAKIGLHIPTENPAEDRESCHVSPRVFDVLAAGCRLLCEEAPLLRETLAGCAYREFRGPQGAVTAVRAALLEGMPAEEAEANRALVAKEHTYAVRVAQILGLTMLDKS
jgi:hypothetical protein